MKKANVYRARTFDELLELKYGKIGTKKRDGFETKANNFVNSEVLKVVRKKSYISEK